MSDVRQMIPGAATPQPVEVSYVVAHSPNLDELVGAVIQLIAQGYQPLGGLAAAGKPGLVGDAGLKFYQAMLRIAPRIPTPPLKEN